MIMSFENKLYLFYFLSGTAGLFLYFYLNSQHETEKCFLYELSNSFTEPSLICDINGNIISVNDACNLLLKNNFISPNNFFNFKNFKEMPLGKDLELTCADGVIRSCTIYRLLNQPPSERGGFYIVTIKTGAQ